MLGKPKYNYEDKVVFSFIDDDKKEKTLKGEIYIVDSYGTFFQTEEPSYDIMVENYNGAPCLFKHVRESIVSLDS